MSDGFTFLVHNDEELPPELLRSGRKGGRTSKYKFAEILPGRFATIPFGDENPTVLVKKVRSAIVVFNKSQVAKGLLKRKFKVVQADQTGEIIVYRRPEDTDGSDD